jgi:dolichol-phosphate mannosyltransferase
MTRTTQMDGESLAMASLQTCPTGPLVIAPSNSDSRIDVSLVLPTYNEGKNIAAVIAQLAPILDSVPNLQYEIIVVDDDSPDRTWESHSA